ncbi:hypothetical protein OH77DRAFT_1463888 [Trametes cingulata]|nr:hypothetical protein OH77DRAFT_1463888 [Trametes cingulata]
MPSSGMHVYDAPLALDPTLSRTNGLDPDVAGARNLQHFSNLRKSIVGPMPVDQFLQRTVGISTSARDVKAQLSARNAFRDIPPTATQPEQIYEPLIIALNKHTKRRSRCPGFVFEDTARRILYPRRVGYAKPHVTCFAERNVDVVRQSSRRSRLEFGYAETFIHVTADVTRDYFTDPPVDVADQSSNVHDLFSRMENDVAQKEIESTLATHIAFVAEVFARQHRSHFLSISMAGSRARLFLWDRAGCVVSRAFDVRERPEYLCDFLWRFSQMDGTARGHDPTVQPASSEEELRFRTAIKEHVRMQLGVEGEQLDKALTQHYAPGRLAVVEVFPQGQTASSSNIHRYIVSRPVVSPTSLVGRGTRGYWAVDSTSSQVVFVKDTWRSTSGDVEGDLLGHLYEIGVRNVPSMVTHGDVPEDLCVDGGTHWQLTHTDVPLSEPWVCSLGGKSPAIRQLQHYRLVMGTVGYGLATIRGTEELLHATYDAFTAMRDALTKDSRIHRDISIGNIILVREPGQDIRRGYLIDWEVSDKVDDAGRSRHPGRAGTWYFMSWRMLHWTEIDSEHTFLDDMESLFHVVTYCAMLYLPHALSREALTGLIEEHFQFTGRWDGVVYGGQSKRANAHDHILLKQVGFKDSSLTEWLDGVLYLQWPRGFMVKNFKYGKHWTPEDLDVYWSTFLRTHSLERNNRVVHELQVKDYDRIPRSDIVRRSTVSSLGKRSSSERANVGDVPGPKRRSAALAQGTLPLMSLTATHHPSDAALHPPLRRSERIKDRLSGPRAVPIAPPPVKTDARPLAAPRASTARRHGRSRRK